MTSQQTRFPRLPQTSPPAKPPAYVPPNVNIIPNLGSHGPVKSIIVEEPTQRGEEPVERMFTTYLTALPSDADPYILLPEEYIVPDSPTHDFDNFHRPLDLFRYYADKYWNMRSYEGSFTIAEEEFWSPIDMISVMPLLPTWQGGNVLPSTSLINHPIDTNFLGCYLREEVTISATPSLFRLSESLGNYVTSTNENELDAETQFEPGASGEGGFSG